jgi:hypothetical protein
MIYTMDEPEITMSVKRTEGPHGSVPNIEDSPQRP